jgi:hypothetical protein
LLGLAYHLDQNAEGPSLTMPPSPRLSRQLFRSRICT